MPILSLKRKFIVKATVKTISRCFNRGSHASFRDSYSKDRRNDLCLEPSTSNLEPRVAPPSMAPCDIHSIHGDNLEPRT